MVQQAVLSAMSNLSAMAAYLSRLAIYQNRTRILSAMAAYLSRLAIHQNRTRILSSMAAYLSRLAIYENTDLCTLRILPYLVRNSTQNTEIRICYFGYGNAHGHLNIFLR